MDTFRLSDLRPKVFALALVACAATAVRAEQPIVDAASAPVFSTTAPAAVIPSFASLNTDDSSLGYSSSTGAAETASAETFLSSAATSALQPPPRRRYGRPRYSDSSHNPDGSNKWTGVAAAGFTVPVGNTHKYNTPSYDFQVGFGRNFNKKFSILAQFDWDNFGLQASTLANENNLYFGQPSGTGLDGSAHAWSFTLNPMYNFWTSDSLGAYVVGGVGFYHKVTTFTLPEDACADIYCEFEYEANENFDHYTSNAPGFSGGLGLTYKVSKFANERFFAEARWVYIDTAQRYGYTVQNVNTTTYDGYNAYPANSNRTSYIPVKFGIRF